MSKILFDEHPIVIPPSLARAIGLKKSIIVQQIHYWIQHKMKDPNKYRNSFHQGRPWVYKTFTQWEHEMPYLGSLRSIKKEFKELQEMGVLTKANFNKKSFDKTNWYTINYQALEHIVASLSRVQKLHDGSAETAPSESAEIALPIPETTQRLQSKTTEEDICANNFAPPQDDFTILNYSFDEEGVMTAYAVSNKVITGTITVDSQKPHEEPPPVAKSPPKYSQAFDAWWQHYPVKRDKESAYQAWKQLKPDAELQKVLIADVENRKQNDPQWAKGYIVYGSKYLKKKRWLDEIEPTQNAVAISHGGPVQNYELSKRQRSQAVLMKHIQGEA